MEFRAFDEARPLLEEEGKRTSWIEGSGLDAEQLAAAVTKIESSNKPKCIIKALCYENLLSNARIAVGQGDIFTEKMDGVGIINRCTREKWDKEYCKNEGKYLLSRAIEADKCGFYFGGSDFGHISPNIELLLNLLQIYITLMHIYVFFHLF